MFGQIGGIAINNIFEIYIPYNQFLLCHSVFPHFLITIIYLKKKYLKKISRMAFAYGWPAYDSRMKKLDENEVHVRPPRMTLRMVRVW